MTVFSVVLAWVSPKLMSAVDPAKREGLVEQLRSEAGVLVSLRQDDTMQVHGKWHSVQKAFGILEEVESFVNPDDESDDDMFTSAASVFGSQTYSQGQGQHADGEASEVIDVKPMLSPQSAVENNETLAIAGNSADELEESVSDDPDQVHSDTSDNLEIVEDEADEDFVLDDDDEDEDYVADIKGTPKSRTAHSPRRRAKQSDKIKQEDLSWKPSKRKRGRPRKITAKPKRSPRSSFVEPGTPYNVRDIAVDVSEDDVEKYMEMLKACCTTAPKGRGRGRPKLNENCVPEVVFVYSPKGTEKTTHTDPRFKDYIISKLETGATVADYIDQFDHLIKPGGDYTGLLDMLKPNATGGTEEGESKHVEKECKVETKPDDKKEEDEDHEEDEVDQQQFMKALLTMVQEVVDDNKKIFKCPKCDYTQSERNSVTRHIQRQHLMRRFLCLVCNRSCGTRPDMRKHLRRHREMHMCGLCGMQYQDVRHMSDHLLTHKDGYVKPFFACTQCEKVFSSKYVLKTHVESVHEGKKKQVPCPECGKCFTQKQNMLEHRNIHTNDRPFVCPICGKGFHSRTSLKNHKILHTDARDFMCQICGKTFRQRLSWKSHMKIHTGQADHACDFCGKRFSQKQAMQRHRRVHTRERPFVCEFCGDAFSDKSILRRHLMGIHKNYQPSRPYNQVIDKMGKPIPPPPPPEAPLGEMEINVSSNTGTTGISSNQLDQLDQRDHHDHNRSIPQHSSHSEMSISDQSNMISSMNLAESVDSSVTPCHSHTPVPSAPLSGTNTPVPTTTPSGSWQDPGVTVPQPQQCEQSAPTNHTSTLPGGLTHEQLAAYMYSTVQPMYPSFYDSTSQQQWNSMKPDGFNQNQ